MADRACPTCEFGCFEETVDPSHGLCRRYPTPVAVTTYHWCGEHRPRPAPPDVPPSSAARAAPKED